MSDSRQTKRILYVASVSSHIKAFHMPFITWLLRQGCQVDCACLMDNPLDGLSHTWEIAFSRSPLSIRNVQAYCRLRQILRDQRYDLVHAHTPVAAFVARLAARDLGVPVLYTAHGFHFHEGAPVLANLIYRQVERFAARWTAGLIVINGEDLESAKSLGFVEGKNLFRVHGVGVELGKYGGMGEHERSDLLESCGVARASPVVLYVAEFTANKNHAFLVDAWASVIHRVPDAVLVLAGKGPTECRVKRQVHMRGLRDSVIFVGYRDDVPSLLRRASLLALSSSREGLPRSVMEAMAAGKPVVATNVRGSRDLVRDGDTGFLVPLANAGQMADAIVRLLTDRSLAEDMGKAGLNTVREYSIDRVLEEMCAIYQKYLFAGRGGNRNGFGSQDPL